MGLVSAQLGQEKFVGTFLCLPESIANGVLALLKESFLNLPFGFHNKADALEIKAFFLEAKDLLQLRVKRPDAADIG